jgi:hypothetical protein
MSGSAFVLGKPSPPPRRILQNAGSFEFLPAHPRSRSEAQASCAFNIGTMETWDRPQRRLRHNSPNGSAKFWMAPSAKTTSRKHEQYLLVQKIFRPMHLGVVCVIVEEIDPFLQPGEERTECSAANTLRRRAHRIQIQITSKVIVNTFENVRILSTPTRHPFHRITIDVDVCCRNNVRAKKFARKRSGLRNS